MRIGFMPIFRCPRISLFFIGIFLVASAPSLSATQAPEQPGGTFRMRVNVELVTVEIVALDKNGHPVKNLQKENFRLFEDGKQQEIYSFDEISGDAPAVIGGEGAKRGKTVLILFDESTLAPGHLKRARDSAESFVRKHMNPQDLFGVASYNSTMTIRQNFTHEPESVLTAIHRSEGASSAPIRSDESSQQSIRGQRFPGMSTPSDPANSAPAYKMENLLWALNSFNVSVEHLKGRKSVLIYSESGFSNQNMLGGLYSSTLSSARRSNVVFYTIDPGGLASGATESPEPDPNAGTLTARTSTPSLAARPALENPVSTSPVSMQPSLLKSLAMETGELAIDNTNDFDSELDKLNLRLSNYYVLGFQSNNPKHDGALRNLEVKSGLKGVTLKYRKEYLDRRPVDLLASSRQEKSLLDAVSSSQAATEIALSFRAACFYDAPDLARVMILASIPTAKIAIRKKGGQPRIDINVMGVAYAADGSIAARFSETIHPAPDPGRASVGYRNFLVLRPGQYRLKMAVSDEGNNRGSAEQSLEIPALPRSGMAASSLVLAGEVSRQPDLIRNVEARLFDESDPLVFSGLQISPSADNKFKLDSPLPIFFKLYNLDKASPWKLIAAARLMGERGQELVTPPIRLDENISKTGDTEATIGITLPLKGIAPGKYKLVIEASDPETRQAVTLQTDLEFVK